MKRIVSRFYLFLIFIVFCSGQLLAASPEAVYKYNESGLAKLKAKDYQGAIADLKQAQSYDPSNKAVLKNLASAYNNYGFDLMQRGQLRLAIEQFEDAVYYDKTNPYIFYNLGQAYYKMQDMPKAKIYLEKAYELNPKIKGLKMFLSKIGQEADVEKRFDKFETLHFIVAFSSDIAVDKMSYIRTYLEEAYGRLGAFLNHYPKKKIITLLYSEKNYQSILKDKPHWTMAIYDGKVRIPANKFKYSNQDVIKIIYHEYAHVLVRDIAKGNAPAWLNEGIAAKLEDFVVPKDRDFIKRYIESLGVVSFKKIPDNFMNIKNAALANLLYIESYLLVDFIISKAGRRGLRSILNYLGRGFNIEDIIRRVFGQSVGSFQKEWGIYIANKYAIEELKFR